MALMDMISEWRPGYLVDRIRGPAESPAPPPATSDPGITPSPYNPLGVYPANGHAEIAGQGHHAQSTGMWAEWFYNNRLP